MVQTRESKKFKYGLMKTFFQTTTVSIVGGFLSYSIIRIFFIRYLWLTDKQLTGEQRYWVHEQGELVFLVGLVVGAAIVVLRKIKHKQEVSLSK